VSYSIIAQSLVFTAAFWWPSLLVDVNIKWCTVWPRCQV